MHSTYCTDNSACNATCARAFHGTPIFLHPLCRDVPVSVVLKDGRHFVYVKLSLRLMYTDSTLTHYGL